MNERYTIGTTQELGPEFVVKDKGSPFALCWTREDAETVARVLNAEAYYIAQLEELRLKGLGRRASPASGPPAASPTSKRSKPPESGGTR